MLTKLKIDGLQWAFFFLFFHSFISKLGHGCSHKTFNNKAYSQRRLLKQVLKYSLHGLKNWILMNEFCSNETENNE